MIWVLGILLAVSLGLNVLLFVGAFRLFDENDNLNEQYDHLKELLFNEAKENAILQSMLDECNELLKQYYDYYYDDYDTTPTIVIDEDWD